MNDNDKFISLWYDFNTIIPFTATIYILKTLNYQYFVNNFIKYLR